MDVRAPQAAVDPELLVGGVATLVSLPEVVIRINQLVDDPRSSAKDIGVVVAQDAALTARLLTLANSAMFGRSRSIDTIGRAIAVLGLRQVRDLALGLSATKAFSGIPNDLVSMDSFWRHSLLCGVAARQLAASVDRGRPDSSFVAGLLHDVGQLVLFNRLPDESRCALLMAAHEPARPPLDHCERVVIGVDHAAVGGALARRWKLPENLVESIAFHHEPARARHHPLIVAITHIANSAAVLAALGSDDFAAAPSIEPVAFEVTGLKRDVVLAVAGGARAAVDEIRHLFQLPELH